MAIFGDRLRTCCTELWEDVLAVAVEPFLLSDAGGSSSSSSSCPKLFADAELCQCARAHDGRSSGGGFGACIWSLPPRTASAREELASFKRRLSLASRWV